MPTPLGTQYHEPEVTTTLTTTPNGHDDHRKNRLSGERLSVRPSVRLFVRARLRGRRRCRSSRGSLFTRHRVLAWPLIALTGRCVEANFGPRGCRGQFGLLRGGAALAFPQQSSDATVSPRGAVFGCGLSPDVCRGTRPAARGTAARLGAAVSSSLGRNDHHRPMVGKA